VIIHSHREHRILPGTVARDLLTDALGNLTVRRTIGSSICSFVFGELESAVVDALCPEEDDELPIASGWRRAGSGVGVRRIVIIGRQFQEPLH
jgi:hypothetical protein